GHRRVDEAGGDGVDADPRRPALRQRPAEADQPRLRGAVVGLAEVAERGARAEVDDGRPLAVTRLERQRQPDRGGEVDVDDGGELDLGHLRRAGVAGDAGVVDEYRDVVPGGGGDRLDARGGGEIGDDRAG